MRPSPVVKRTIRLDGHNTSISVEEEFWSQLKRIADQRQTSVAKLVVEIDAQRDHGNLSSAIRLFVLKAH